MGVGVWGVGASRDHLRPGLCFPLTLALGTLPAPLCVGLGAACEIAQQCMEVCTAGRASGMRTTPFVSKFLHFFVVYVVGCADVVARGARHQKLVLVSPSLSLLLPSSVKPLLGFSFCVESLQVQHDET